MADDFFQLPPDGNGKRIFSELMVRVKYASSTRTILKGEDITGATSNVAGKVLNVLASTANSGSIWVLPNDPNTAIFTAGENLTIAASTVANVATGDAGTHIYTQAVFQAGGNNPKNLQSIDNQGQAFMRFAEGPVQLDAYGLARVVQPVQIGEYIHTINKLPKEWSEKLSGSGNILHLTQESCVRQQVGTSSGDESTRTTNKYHRYQAGSSQNILMTIASGDTGKTNVRRRWGYFDDNDGVYFELDGSTLYVVLRSSVTGSIVNTRIAQSAWNGDRIDGSSNSTTNKSGMNVDVSKFNIYWVDLQWLGVGRVRLGTYSEEGERLTCHTFLNSNSNTTPYMNSATLPIRSEIVNTGISGSTSELKFSCGSVFTEGTVEPEQNKWHIMKFQDVRSKNCSTTVEVPIISLRSALTVGSSVTNRVGAEPEGLSLRIQSNPCIIRIRENADLVGASFTFNHGATSADVSATSISAGSGTILYSSIFDIGITDKDVDEHFNYLGKYLRLNADSSTTNTYTITAEPMEASATVDLSFSWFEFQETGVN